MCSDHNSISLDHTANKSATILSTKWRSPKKISSRAKIKKYPCYSSQVSCSFSASYGLDESSLIDVPIVIDMSDRDADVPIISHTKNVNSFMELSGSWTTSDSFKLERAYKSSSSDSGVSDGDKK